MKSHRVALAALLAVGTVIALVVPSLRAPRPDPPSASWSESCQVLLTPSTTSTAGPAVPVGDAMEASPAVPTECFVSSVGVGTHLTYKGEYSDKAAIERRVLEAGIQRVRASWDPGDTANRDLAVRLGKRGVKIMFWTGQIGSNLEAVKRAIKETNDLAPGTIDAIEGPNEQDGDPRLRAFVEEYSSVLRADPATAGLRIYGPSMANVGSSGPYRALGDISAWVDAANVHDYPGGRMMTDTYLDFIYRYTRQNVGATGSLISSELGYSNAVSAAEQPHPAVPRDVAAVLIPRLFLEHFRRGIAETYVYELVDQSGESPWEAQFGLLDKDFQPKPAFTAIKNMQQLLADPGPVFSPGSLKHRLDGTDDATRTLLLQKRDGSFWLAIWEQREVWDRGTRQPVELADREVVLTLADKARIITYRPVESSQAQSSTQGSTATIPVDASPTFIEIVPSKP